MMIPGFTRRTLRVSSLKVDTVSELTADAGVTIDGALVKDNALGSAAAPVANVIATQATTDTILERTADNGVNVDECRMRNGRASQLVAPFKSAIQTGTGVPQVVAHTLGVTPSLVVLLPQELASATDVFTEQVHTSTEIKMVVATGAKFIALAWP